MNLNKNSIKKLVLIFLICAADILWSAGFIYLWKTKGVVLSVKEASVNIPGIFVQNLIVEAVPILLFFLFLFRLGKNFQTEMYLKITGKMQKCTVGILGGILLALALWCLVTKADKVTVLYNLLYYTVFIAFAEEFVVRGIGVYLVRGEEPYIRYLAPNLLFAVMHLFSYANWGAITVPYVISFVSSELLGLLTMGCIFQFLKEKSGTLWTAVLVHAILDYSVVLSYQ